MRKIFFSFKAYTILILLSVAFYVSALNSRAQKNFVFYRDNERVVLTPSYDQLFITFRDKNTLLKWETILKTQSVNAISFLDAKLYQPANSLRITLPNDIARNLKSCDKLIDQLIGYPEIVGVHPSFIVSGERWYVDLRIIFEFQKDKSSKEAEDFLKLHHGKRVESIDLGDRIQVVYESGKQEDLFSVANVLHESGTVSFAQPVFTITAHEDFTPNDASYSAQTFLNQASDADIDAPEAWNFTHGSSSVKVAVIDGNGYDMTHADMTGKYVNPYDAVIQDTDPSPENANAKHGTPCAGLIGAATNNTTGVASVGFDIKVVPIVIGYNATSTGNFETDDAIIARAAAHVIATSDIVAVSNSWGSSGYTNSWVSSYNSMRSNTRGGLGSVILVSTGNNGLLNTALYPALFTCAVGVGATEVNDTRASFSNYGTPMVDVSAPGVSDFTIDRTGSAGYSSNDYTSFSGTSAACPVAAGVVGLIASVNTSLTALQLETLLCKGCDKVGGYSYTTNSTYGTKSSELGYGRVNAYNSLNQYYNCNATPTLSPSGFVSACVGDTITLTAANGSSYLWSTSATTASIKVAASGTYSVTVSNAAPCVSSFLTVNVSFQSKPSAPVISAGGSQTICSGASVALSTTAVGGVNYQWRKNGVDIAGATSSSYNASQQGTYDLKARFANVALQTFTNSTSTSIPDNSCTGGNRTIAVAAYTSAVSSSAITVKVNITHTYLGDVDLLLETPTGQILALSTRAGSPDNSGQNYVNTIFSDAGAAPIADGGAPYTGTYKPSPDLLSSCIQSTITTFSAIGGGTIIPNGNWILRVYDRATMDAGTINNWSITFPAATPACYSFSNSIPVTVNYCDFNIASKIFLQGLYLNSNTMRAVIDSVNFPNLCDTIIMQLASPVNPYNILYSSQAVLQTNGNCSFHFVTTPAYGQYYLVIRHRNSLETWSKDPVLINSAIVNFDLTTQ